MKKNVFCIDDWEQKEYQSNVITRSVEYYENSFHEAICCKDIKKRQCRFDDDPKESPVSLQQFKKKKNKKEVCFLISCLSFLATKII
jgi:hypothetical protein